MSAHCLTHLGGVLSGCDGAALISPVQYAVNQLLLAEQGPSPQLGYLDLQDYLFVD